MTLPTTISFFVAGIPAPGGSKKAFIYHKGGKAHAAITDDAGKRNADWRSAVALTAAGYFTEPLHDPLALGLYFTVSRPKSHYGSGRNAGAVRASAPQHPTKKPDLSSSRKN